MFVVDVLKKLKKAMKKSQRKYYSFKVRRLAVEVGEGLKVNGMSQVTTKTRLGNNVNFNGMKITGGGEVYIGSNFHSGPECLMISQNHNFDGGTKIPYDDSYIYKNIVIEPGKTHEDSRHAWASNLMTKLSLRAENRALCHIY